MKLVIICLKLFKGTSPREIPCLCSDEAGNIYSFAFAYLPIVLLLLRQSRFAAGNDLGTGLGTTISNVRECS
jgi:hypothetical protein